MLWDYKLTVYYTALQVFWALDWFDRFTQSQRDSCISIVLTVIRSELARWTEKLKLICAQSRPAAKTTVTTTTTPAAAAAATTAAAATVVAQK